MMYRSDLALAKLTRVALLFALCASPAACASLPADGSAGDDLQGSVWTDGDSVSRGTVGRTASPLGGLWLGTRDNPKKTLLGNATVIDATKCIVLTTSALFARFRQRRGGFRLSGGEQLAFAFPGGGPPIPVIAVRHQMPDKNGALWDAWKLYAEIPGPVPYELWRIAQNDLALVRLRCGAGDSGAFRAVRDVVLYAPSGPQDSFHNAQRWIAGLPQAGVPQQPTDLETLSLFGLRRVRVSLSVLPGGFYGLGGQNGTYYLEGVVVKSGEAAGSDFVRLATSSVAEYVRVQQQALVRQAGPFWVSKPHLDLTNLKTLHTNPKPYEFWFDRLRLKWPPVGEVRLGNQAGVVIIKLERRPLLTGRRRYVELSLPFHGAATADDFAETVVASLHPDFGTHPNLPRCIKADTYRKLPGETEELIRLEPGGPSNLTNSDIESRLSRCDPTVSGEAPR